MIQSISDKIAHYKSGNYEVLNEILEQMEPLVISYAKKTFSLEFEDAKQEYYIAIINACNKIKTYENDAQCLTYFQLTVKNRYYNFCKDFFSAPTLLPINEELPFAGSDFDLAVIYIDLQRFIIKLADANTYMPKIFYYAYIGMSDAEIGKRLGITRQYVYLLRKKIFQKLMSEYFKT